MKIRLRNSGLALLLAAAAASAQTPKRINRVIEMFERGERPLGVFATNLTPRGGAAMSGSALDFAIVDLEHSPYDPTRLEGYLLGMTDKRRVAAEGLQMKVVPLIRLPANGRERVEYMIKQVLDLGAAGVVVPHVSNREEALAAVRAMRFAQREGAKDREPEGRRGVGYGWAARYWGLPALEYVARADLWPLDPAGELLLWCMIENPEGVANAREIASTPGVSGVFLGPSDLSMSLGVTESDPKTEAAIARVVDACKETKTPCGTLTSGEGVARRLEQGFRFLAIGSDSGLSGAVERGLQIGRKAK